jgi:hopanoid biosynthesis associated RND transporter like protein HpnN
MRPEQDHSPEADWLPRIVAAVVGVGCRRPWLVLAFALLSCAACGWYTWTRLVYQTHRNDLISQNKDYLKRWQQYIDEFGDDEDLVVVVQGNNRRRMEAALEDLAGDVQSRPDLYDRLFYKVDLRALSNRALLFLPIEQIRAVQEHLQGMSLLLEPPIIGGLDPWIGWRSLGLQQLLREAERRGQAWKSDQPNPEAESFFKQLDAICRGATGFLHEPEKYQSPWRSVLPEQAGQTDLLAKPQYFFNKEESLAFLLCRPAREKEGFAYSQKSIDTLRTLLTKLRDRYADLEIGLTGLPVLENDEMIASQNDSNTASWLALIGVALLYLVVYRGFRYPFMTVAALLVGTCWALGWLTLTVGHLNILSSAFAVMLIGMGDYGVLWVTRFTQERRDGAKLHEAMKKTAWNVGPSILTAAVATTFSFYAAMLADLKAVAELGWIAGSGVLFCAISCILIVPALLTLFDGRFQKELDALNDQPILSLKDHADGHRKWLPGLLRWPRAVVACSVLSTLLLGWLALHIPYDHNLLNMQDPKLPSVQWEQRLMDQTVGASWHALSFTTTPEEALALKARYEQLPEVSHVVEVASLVPREQDRKREMMQNVQLRLRRLPKRGELIEHAKPNLASLQDCCSSVLSVLARIEGKSPDVANLRSSVHSLRVQLLTRGTDATAYALQQYEQFMARDLADDLHRLRDASTPGKIDVEDLPMNLRERYIGKNGKWLLRVFCKESLWNFEPLQRFVSQVRSVDSEATGKPFTTLEGLIAMRNGFLWAGLYAFLAMVVVLLLDFGSVKHTLVSLLPLGMGMIASLGLMQLFGFPLNPANMIAFPLILGVGADNGVHVLHDFRSRDRSRRYRLSLSTGRGIMVSALTTILGFGTLMIAQHRGMASLGLLLTVGVTCCMFTALVFLPAMLGILSETRMTPRTAAAPPVSEERQAA